MGIRSNTCVKPHIVRKYAAGAIDYTFIYIFFIAIAMYVGEQAEDGSYSLSGVNSLIPIGFWFIITVGIEQITGATIGNGIVGLKPLNEDGKNKPDLFQSIKRHLLDPIDMFFFGLVAVIAIKNTPKHQRLGDLWAKTIVVKG